MSMPSSDHLATKDEESAMFSDEDMEESHGFLSNLRKSSESGSPASSTTSQLSGRPSITTISLLTIILIQGIYLISSHVHATNTYNSKPFLTPNGLNRETTVERTTYLPSVYWSPNETAADEAWEYISSGHGIVAVDADYARAQGLPESEVWRKDHSKRVYILEAYHAIHCIRRLRTHYLTLLHSSTHPQATTSTSPNTPLLPPWNWPIAHDMHCLDGLREYVMCNPDDTLLWTTGHGDVGHGQNKQCRDWDELRDWAAERTIAYHDYERGFEEETRGVWHAGDGLPVGSF